MNIRADQAWLLQSRFNPSPISGALTLDDGRITFTLDEQAADAPLGWLEKELELEDLEAKLGAGEEVVAFDYDLADCAVTWPITGGGAMMIVRTPSRKWVVSYDYPSGGPVHGTLALVGGRKKAKEWKKALAELDA